MAPAMTTPATLPDEVLDAPVEGTGLRGARTLREALGPRPSVVLFVRHFG